ncbi:hypothetical protein GCM10010836_18780 [Aminobacter aminovorans]
MPLSRQAQVLVQARVSAWAQEPPRLASMQQVSLPQAQPALPVQALLAAAWARTPSLPSV